MCNMLLHHFRKCFYTWIQGLAKWLSRTSFDSQLTLERWPYFRKKLERFANLYCVREKETMFGDLNGGSYGVASTGTGLVKRLHRTFVLVEELFKGLWGSSMTHEQSKKQEYWTVITESYWRLKRPFYWILFLTIQECIWMKWRASLKSWQEKLCTLLHFAGKLLDWG